MLNAGERGLALTLRVHEKSKWPDPRSPDNHGEDKATKEEVAIKVIQKSVVAVDEKTRVLDDKYIFALSHPLETSSN